VGPDFVVVLAPFSNAISGLWQALKPLLIQTFVSELSIETLDVAVLHGSARLNQVWALDFMRDTLYDGRPFRTLNVIDEGNREALRIECGTSIPSARLVRAMNQLIEVYGAPEAVRMDNGPEMTSETFTEWAKEKGIALLFIQPGKPNQNAFVERFNRSFRDEVLDANLFNSIAEAQEAAEIWVMDYNEFRPHDSLGDKTPMEFMPRTFKTGISSFELPT